MTNPYQSIRQEGRLRWSMRIVGLLLGLACVFLLTRDVVRTDEAVVFLAIGCGLGLITFLSSWFSAPATPEPEPIRS